MPTIPYKLKDGTPVQGITTIISNNLGWGGRPLQFWANKQGRQGKTLQEAWDTATKPGTLCHLLIEKWLHDEHDFITSIYNMGLESFSAQDVHYAVQAFEGFLAWTKNFELKPMYVEHSMIHEKYKYGGTPDVIGTVNGRLALIDWKSSNSIYTNIFLQLRAYSELTIHTGIGKIEEYHVLRVNKALDTPAFVHYFWKSLPKEAWEAVKAILVLNKAEKKLKELL